MSIICTKKVEDLNASCRVCLKSCAAYYEFQTPVDLQKMDGPTFADAIKSVTNNMTCFVAPDRNTNFLICSICAEELKIAFRFLEKAKKAQESHQPQPPDPDVEIKTETDSLNELLYGGNLEYTNATLVTRDGPLDPLNFERNDELGNSAETGDDSPYLLIEESIDCDDDMKDDVSGNDCMVNEPMNWSVNKAQKRPFSRESREDEVSPRITSLNLESLFEIAKLIGSVRSGQPLKNKDRINAGKAVVEKVLEVLGFDYRFKKVDFEYLSSKLESFFNDPPGMYYLPAVNGCPARGILLHLYYTRRTDLSKKNIICRRKKMRKLVIDSELTAAGNREYQDVIQLFADPDNNWEQIKELWSETRDTRLSMWQSETSGLQISDIFKSFPFLVDSKTDELVLEDFKHLHPLSMNFLEKWKTTNYKNVLNHARSYRDDYARNLIGEIDLKTNKEDKMLLTLLLIPYIMAPNGRKMPNGESASKNTIQEGFICILRDSESYNNWLQTDDGHNDYALRFLWQNGCITQATYNIKEHEYVYTKPADAFVNLFAKLIVFNMKLPKLCNHVWQFVQKGVFGIPVERAFMVPTTQKALKTVNL